MVITVHCVMARNKSKKHEKENTKFWRNFKKKMTFSSKILVVIYFLFLMLSYIQYDTVNRTVPYFPQFSSSI
jgi:hypothetical protein